MESRELEGKRALVAGGGRNLGAAAAIELARRGAAVAINTRSESAEALTTSRLIGEAGRRAAVTIYGDVSDPSEARRVVAAAAEQLDGIDILVSTVGRGPIRPFLELEFDEWSRVLHSNLTSLCFLSQAVLPKMVERGWGRIIGVAGHTNLRGDAQRASSAAAKSGLIGLVRSLSSEFYAQGITTNLISPGAFDTTRDADTGAPNANRRERYGLARLGRPDEFAATCAFLVSPGAGYITGQNILVNGGMLYQ